MPTHFFWSWQPPWSYWQGHLIDYWIPKIYVGQIMVGLLWLVTVLIFAWWWRNNQNTTRDKTFKRLFLPLWQRRRIWAWAMLVIGTWLLRQFYTPQPAATIYGLINVFTYPIAFFAWWRLIGRQIWPRPGNTLSIALVTAVTIQAILGWYQLLWQKHLGGYWLLGQPIFDASSNLAQNAWGDTVRTLPYGSTPHPNILAGWLVMGIISLSFSSWDKGLKIFISTLFFILLVATESWTAGGCLALYLIWRARQKLWRLSNRTLLLVAGGLNVLFTILPLLIYRIFWTRNWEMPISITRRAWLTIASWPSLPTLIWGTGWLQSLTEISAWELAHIGMGFLQPAHSFWVLFVIENGIWTILLLSLFWIFAHKNYPLIMLLFILLSPIFSLDHYFYTTIVGQNLLVCFMIFFASLIDGKRHYN